LILAGSGRAPAHSLGPNRREIAAGSKATANTHGTGLGRSGRRSAPIANPRAADLRATQHTHTCVADPQRLTATKPRLKTGRAFCDTRSHAVESGWSAAIWASV
jgi:hypothetical protein